MYLRVCLFMLSVVTISNENDCNIVLTRWLIGAINCQDGRIVGCGPELAAGLGFFPAPGQRMVGSASTLDSPNT